MHRPNHTTVQSIRLVISLLLVASGWLTTVGVGANAIAIVSKIAGFATISEASGASHELGSAEPLRSAATVTTAIDSLAAVNLDQVGRVQLGPQTKARVSVRSGGLWLGASSGLLCVVSQSQNINVSAGTLQISPAAAGTIYDLSVRPSGLELAVFRGGVVIGSQHTATNTIYAGGAVSADDAGKITDTPIASLVQDFTALQCPDPNIVSEVVHPESQPAGTTGGHHGLTSIIIGTLLGLGAIVAAAGHGSSSSSGGTQSLSVSPSSLTFTNIGTTLSVGVSEPGYSGPLTESSNTCTGVASVNLTSGSGPNTTVNVTSQSAGSCRFDINDDHSQSAAVNVTVGPFGAVQSNPSSLSTKVGAANSIVQVSESGYTGTFSVNASACNGIVGVSPPSGNSFTISPGTAGNCKLTFSDDHSQTGQTLVFVTAGTMMLNPQTLQLSGVGDMQSFIASDSAPTTFIYSSSNLAVATVTLVNVTSNAATFNVTGISTGKATIMVTDTIGGAGNVSVGVGQAPLIANQRRSSSVLRAPTVTTKALPPHRIEIPVRAEPYLPPLSVSPLSLTFNMSPDSRTITVNEATHGGPLFVTSSNPSVATAYIGSATNGLRIVTVTAKRRGIAVIRIADDRGEQASIPVTVER